MHMNSRRSKSKRCCTHHPLAAATVKQLLHFGFRNTALGTTQLTTHLGSFRDATRGIQRQIVGVGHIHFMLARGLNPPLNLGFGITRLTPDLQTNTWVGFGVVTGGLANWSGLCPNRHGLLCMASCLVLLQIDRQTHRLEKRPILVVHAAVNPFG